eukprot:TRINITY_DN1723_c0_g1_i1.p1 TRINITY_DN1723_c0_g1~~TRINITY_DN1723_c0_g1_i1.p1  ORF type:complete len:476 (-),score=105.93 TRINITY_DN1723_c0_g1_i1:179-1606(-)
MSSSALSAADTAVKAVARDFLSFVDASPSPFHAVETVVNILKRHSFQAISERDSWALQKKGLYYVTRNRSSVLAFAVGGKYEPGNGFSIIGAHTDSPNLRVKTNSALTKSGYLEIGIETYGGGLWHTWFDRDLSLAGRVFVQNSDGSFDHRLVHIKRPIMRIPNLAIHLHSAAEREAFKFNNQNHLRPILASAIQNELLKPAAFKGPTGAFHSRHHPILLEILSKELDVDVSQIKEVELSVCDTQPGQLGGVYEEFIHSPRLDNLQSSYCAVQGLVEGLADLEDETNIRLVALYDHEEIGSQSFQGADSNFLQQIMSRIATNFSSTKTVQEVLGMTLQRSFLMSADVAHAVHPNYSEKHDENHMPHLHQGAVVKVNVKQNYATNSYSLLAMTELAEKNKIPVQFFQSRNDSPCGCTIGPIVSAASGIRGVDLGAPMWSMHSIRETASTVDLVHTRDLMKVFLQQFSQLEGKLAFE